MSFSFQDQFYEQVKGAAMGSLVSPIVSNLYIENFEQRTLSAAPHPTPGFGTGMWMTHFSSTRKSTNKTSHNMSTVLTLPFSLQWRTIRRMGSSPSWTPLIKPEADGKLSTTVYRKPTHIDQYVQWDGHHHLSAKFSVIHTLSHRAQTVCSNPELPHKEKTHLRNALTNANTPNGLWARLREGLTNLQERLQWS